ncbi:DUF1684 domain-containing protein [Wenzhouxiangella sp. XN79A]|uniref:DUF1684 domain-containing protein n=1 Tax=Wenzhouxiangella sp. XN79A TaxID=2724193 RepID=UPI00144A85FC|nr:DUF1684 domain-containing protein [Wenzhouxiangella sp. XN79A]NKI35947.1 DUF1684 domain-containing protein [Wenzhouxiangella sp. XN79A]
MDAREPRILGGRCALVALLIALLALAGCDGGRDAESDASGGYASIDDAEAEFRRDVMDWRERRLNRLLEPYGYLSLVGLVMLEPGEYRLGADDAADIVLPRGPARWGTLTVDGTEVRFRVSGQEVVGSVTVDGEIAVSATLVAGDEPTRIEAEGVRVHLVTPGERIGLRIRDPQAETRTGFAGLDYFPIDPALRITGTWVPHEPGRTVTIANVLGQLIDEPNPGRVEFELDGVRHSLEAIDSGDDLFYIVADRTSGGETYGLGRFLYTDWPDEEGRVVLDFNRLYNPPCAFNAFTTCPLPPQGNRLDAWLRAGELKYAGPAGLTEPEPVEAPDKVDADADEMPLSAR